MLFKPSKKGDKGKTTFAGKRVVKDSPMVVFVGRIDSFQAELSKARKSVKLEEGYFTSNQEYINVLDILITDMYKISCALGGTTVELSDIDELLLLFPVELQNKFQYPKFDNAAVEINLCRTKARELELFAWKLKLDDTAKYLNRLSSLLFSMMCHYNTYHKGETYYAGDMLSPNP